VTRRFHAVVVAAGQPGPPLAGRLTDAGQTVAVVERKHVGGTCGNTWCIPTKTLVAGAHAAHLARRGTEYGVGTGSVTVEVGTVKAPKDGIMLNDRAGLETWLDSMAGCAVISRARTLRKLEHVAGQRRRDIRGQDIPQRWWPGGGAQRSRLGRRPLPDQRVDPRT
jgi:pyruvate/2-oxoglutarate dehydrogenase complex dihydrolipoamide dehydrogenase (E3) component